MGFLRSSATARRAALIATALLAASTVVHLYWALGGALGLHAVSQVDNPSTSGGRIFYAVIALLAIPVALELLAVARALPQRLHVPAVRRLVWVLAGLLAVGGLARTAAAPAVGIAALVFAALFAEVAYGSAPRAAAAEQRAGSSPGRP